MTIRNSAKNPILVEMGRESIVAYFRDGSVVIDDDVNLETSGKSVDFFIKPNGTPGDQFVISRSDLFRADAERWGPVRDRLADAQELNLAQGRLNHALVSAHEVIADFRWAVEHNTVRLEREGRDGPWQFRYRTQNEETLTFRVELSSGRKIALQSLTLEDEEDLRVVVRDPSLLQPFQKKLNLLLVQYQRLSRSWP